MVIPPSCERSQVKGWSSSLTGSAMPVPHLIPFADFLLHGLLFRRQHLAPPDLNGELVQLPGEAERVLIVLVVHGCAGVATDVEGLVPLENERSGVRNFLAGHLCAVDLQNSGAAFADPGPIVSE